MYPPGPALALVLLFISALCATARSGVVGDADTTPVLLRVCPGLDRIDLIEALEARVPQVRLVLGHSAGALAAGVAEVCFDGTTVTSSVTDTRTGATDSRTVPLPTDASPEDAQRIVARLLASQMDSLLDVSPGEVLADVAGDTRGDRVPDAADAGSGDRAVGLDILFDIGINSIGGLGGRMDEATIAVGPRLGLGVRIDDVGLLGLDIGSLSILGRGAGPSVGLLPLTLAGGFLLAVGPVELGGILGIIAERWSPQGEISKDGWRAGLGLSGRLAIPFWWLLDVRLDAGVDYFPEAYTFGYGSDIIAELSNWRWRLTLGLGVRIPVL